MEQTVKQPTNQLQATVKQVKRGIRKFISNPSAVIGLCGVLILFLIAIFAPWITDEARVFEQELAMRASPPSALHILGTDDLGRDIFSRLIYGTRITLFIVTLTALISGPVGLLIGTVSGYFGGLVDSILMRVVDVFLAFPSLILALAFVAALGPGIENAVIAISLASWPPIARLARAETLAIRNSDYIAAIRIQGASHLRIVGLHIMPMCITSVIVRVSLNMAAIILATAGLGFLGLGAQPPDPEWGTMLAAGRQSIDSAWWIAAMPGFAILFTSLSFNLLGDGLRDVLDPRND